jgi:hypothetical protein
MKVAIIKDYDLQTVGFEVKKNKSTLLSWGVKPFSRKHYTIGIYSGDCMDAIQKLIQLQAEIDQLRNHCAVGASTNCRELKRKDTRMRDIISRIF